MYFPYLRGKQFELIALREISKFLVENQLVSPIIEPVKETTVTLEKTLSILIENNQNFNLIFNPVVGDIAKTKGFDEIIRIKDDLIRDYNNYQPTLIIDSKSRIEALSEIVNDNKLLNLSIICNSIPNEEEEFFSFIENNPIKYLIINEGINSKRFLRNIRSFKIDMVSLTDPFKILRRNVDYIDNDNEFYSDEHLFFEEEGYVGFADFLTIGQEYSDTGFLPYAVAIHLTYQNSNDEFWIRHFVSNSNEDNTDVVGKFVEALTKLIRFIDEQGIDTLACKEFKKLFESQTYSGLGSIKKLSILHHIELVYNFLNSRK
ncbi:MAG: sce7725 family protein [Bacteroidales bacterium]|nr:sce7725 family protein [Bacteroidales bacterium]